VALRVLEHFVAEPRACSYLDGREATLEYRLMMGVEPDELDRLLERGWRRFGLAYFRPACAACAECVPLRIPVEGFELSRNLRRIRKRGQALELRVAVPSVDDERIELYQRWHGERADRRGWDDDGMTAERYFHEFAFPHPSARELSWYDLTAGPPRLVAVSLVDETPSALSAVYTYSDPSYERWSLGTLSILSSSSWPRGPASAGCIWATASWGARRRSTRRASCRTRCSGAGPRPGSARAGGGWRPRRSPAPRTPS
jgi:arginyl-tRNA--protein-N-Asp/Glu arginylyltransferase